MIEKLVNAYRARVNTMALRAFSTHPHLYMRWLYGMQRRRFDGMIRRGEQYVKHLQDNIDVFDGYGDRELIAHEKSGWHCLADGKLQWLPAKIIRERYVDVLCQEIDAALSRGATPSVLEVGCGNCINLVSLKERYGDKVALSGFDVSPGRILSARAHFGSRLDGIDLRTASAIDPSLASVFGCKFGIVFSMHCLEQLPHDLDVATQNMISLAEDRVVFIEPEYEFGYPVQRLYLILADHCRALMGTLRRDGRNISRAAALDIQSSTKNQSSIIVVDLK